MTATAPRRYHHGNLREELLRQAEAVVREQGVDALSLRDLARAAGVSHAAPRRHFPDRRALLDALALRGYERLRGEIVQAAGDGPGGFGGRLRRVADAYVAFATREAALLDLMFASKHGEQAGPVRDAAQAAFAPVLELIAAAQGAGELAGEDPLRPGKVLLTALHGIAALAVAGLLADADLDRVLDDTLAALRRGLAA